MMLFKDERIKRMYNHLDAKRYAFLTYKQAGELYKIYYEILKDDYTMELYRKYVRMVNHGSDDEIIGVSKVGGTYSFHIKFNYEDMVFKFNKHGWIVRPRDLAMAPLYLSAVMRPLLWQYLHIRGKVGEYR